MRRLWSRYKGFQALWSASRFVPALEELIPADELGIVPIPDLDPGGIAVLDHVPAQPVLGDRTLQVSLACQLEEALALALYMVDVEQEWGARRQDPAEIPFALD